MPIISNFPSGAGLPDGGTEGQLLTMGAQGEAIWEDAPDTGVTSFKGRKGAVTPESGDYTAEMVGAMTQEQGDGRYIQLEDGGTAVMGESIGSGPFTITFEDDEDLDLSAGEIAYDNSTSGMSAVNTQDAIDELFQSVSEGKSLIAAAVTGKGVETAATDSFAEMAENIEAIESGTSLPALTDPGTEADLAQGKQLIGQDGEIVTGTILEYAPGSNVASSGNSIYRGSSGSSLVEIGVYKNITQDMILRSGAQYAQYLPASYFGTATAADVAAGKTFTSEAGVAVTGACRLGWIPVYTTGQAWFVTNSGSTIMEFDVPYENVNPGNVRSIIVRRYGSFADTGYNFAEMAYVYIDSDNSVMFSDVVASESTGVVYGTVTPTITGRHVKLDLSSNTYSNIRWAGGYLIYVIVTTLDA